MRFAVILVLAATVACGMVKEGRAADPGPATVSFNLQNQSPEYLAKTWTIDEGLPLNGVWTIEQTQDGMLWAGTLDGLARFDGHSITTYTASSTNGLAGNRVVGLYEDAEGTLWIGTHTGVSIYRDGTFRRVEEITGHVENFGEGSNGTLWMSGNGGVYRATKDRSVTSVRVPDLVRGKKADGATDGDAPGRKTVAGTSGGSGWVGIGKTLWRVEEGTFHRPEELNAILETPIQTMKASSGRLVVATEAALVSVENGHVEPYSHDGGPIREIELTPSGEVWLSTAQSGLLRLSGDTLDRVDTGGVIGDRLRGLTRDEYGQWWVGDQTSGLVRLRPRLFQAVTGGLPDGPAARGVYADESGAVWTGLADQGVFRFTDSTQVQWTEKQGIDGQFVRPIAEDETGAVWIGTEGGLSRHKGARFETVTRPDGMPFQHMTALQRDATDTLWVASGEQGLFWYHSGTFGRAFPDENPISSRVMGLRRTQDGSLWIGTRGDGIVRRTAEGTVEVYDTDDGVPYRSVRDIYETDDGTIWISTSGGGIARFEGDHFTAVTPDDGLPHRSIHLIREAPKGVFWMTSNGGVFRVPRAQVEAVADGNRERLYAQTFGREDGMPARECNGPIHPAFAKDGAGRLWIPTVDGLAVVDPQSPQLAIPDSMPVRITAIRADGTPQPLDSLRFAPSTYRLAVDFTAVSLRHADAVSFRYRLDEGPWTPAEGRRTAEFTSLDAGLHRFEVQATIDGETWYTLASPLRFTVAPHFYETWWFRLLVGLGLVGLAVGAYRWRTYRLRRRQEELQAAVVKRTHELAQEKKKTEQQAERLAELDEAKNRFFAHISHEFRTPLSLILSPIRDALQRTSEGVATLSENQLRRMGSNADRLRRLIDQLLDLATLEAGRMELEQQPGDLSVLVERSAEAFRSRAVEKEIDLTIETPDGRIETRFDPEKVETITSNLVANAVKFTPAGGKITVRVEATDRVGAVEAPENGETVQGTIWITVSDTGPGIEPAVQDQIFNRFEQADNSPTREHEGTGLGLALTSALVELHGGTVNVESALGEGSTFTVQLPLVPIASGDGIRRRGDSETRRYQGVKYKEAESKAAVAKGEIRSEANLKEVGAEEATVLVVEDNAEMRAYLQEELVETYAVLTAADGEKGWEIVQAEEPDLVISDVMMPNVDGFELCRRIKTDSELRTIPVLLLTARAGEEATLKGLESGADDYVAKPFGSEELRGRIANHLAARQHLAARYREEVEIQTLDVVVDAEDQPFVEEVLEVIEERLANPDFGVAELASEVALSRRQLTRRLKDTIGTTPGDLIHRRRIERGKALLHRDVETVSEVAYATGFRSPSAFSQSFKKEVGELPSEYAKHEEEVELDAASERVAKS